MSGTPPFTTKPLRTVEFGSLALRTRTGVYSFCVRCQVTFSADVKVTKRNFQPPRPSPYKSFQPPRHKDPFPCFTSCKGDLVGLPEVAFKGTVNNLLLLVAVQQVFPTSSSQRSFSLFPVEYRGLSCLPEVVVRVFFESAVNLVLY